MRSTDNLAQKRSRGAAAMDRCRRVKTTHLSGPDVTGHCTRCGGPIFAQSLNVEPVHGLHVDGSQKRKHVRCPQVAA